MKNKYQEAFNFLFNYEVLHKNVPNVGRATKGSLELECWNNLKELVDKETPSKVVFESNGSPIKSARCPKCNGLIHFGFETYCYYCGTKLRWE